MTTTTNSPDPRSIALGARLKPLLAAYEAAEVSAAAAEEATDAAFEVFQADRTEANQTAWTTSQAASEFLNAAKWSAFEAFRVEMQHGY